MYLLILLLEINIFHVIGSNNIVYGSLPGVEAHDKGLIKKFEEIRKS